MRHNLNLNLKCFRLFFAHVYVLKFSDNEDLRHSVLCLHICATQCSTHVLNMFVCYFSFVWYYILIYLFICSICSICLNNKCFAYRFVTCLCLLYFCLCLFFTCCVSGFYLESWVNVFLMLRENPKSGQHMV